MSGCKGVWLGNRCSDPDCCKPQRLIPSLAHFAQVHLSERSADMMKSLEQASTQMGAALTYEQHHEAYRHLTAVREVVYKRLEQLEKLARVTDRPCAFRF